MEKGSVTERIEWTQWVLLQVYCPFDLNQDRADIIHASQELQSLATKVDERFPYPRKLEIASDMSDID